MLEGIFELNHFNSSELLVQSFVSFQRVFPCMDEPSHKAKFRITLGRPRNMTTLSNMPLEKTVTSDDKLKPVDGYVWDVYEQSVPMSTYLVAFVVCDFVSKSSGKDFSVWARKDAIRSMDYALKIGPKVLNFLEDFFGIKYPLPKTDMIAIPDFAYGAMGKYFANDSEKNFN